MVTLDGVNEVGDVETPKKGRETAAFRQSFEDLLTQYSLKRFTKSKPTFSVFVQHVTVTVQNLKKCVCTTRTVVPHAARVPLALLSFLNFSIFIHELHICRMVLSTLCYCLNE